MPVESLPLSLDEEVTSRRMHTQPANARYSYATGKGGYDETGRTLIIWMCSNLIYHISPQYLRVARK